MKIVITGAGGLLGSHAVAHLHAANCAAAFHGRTKPYEIAALDHSDFDDDLALGIAVTAADGVLHFAGVNRASDDVIEAANPAIAQRLVDAITKVGATPHIVYANTIHAGTDTPYGRAKAAAEHILSASTSAFTDMVLPHIFGEGARPFYNNVTATLIQQLMDGVEPTINSEGRVALCHAGAAVHQAIGFITEARSGRIELASAPMKITELWDKLQGFHEGYQNNIYPDLADPFDVALFNTYRTASYPDGWPRALKMNTDARGTLFEAVKGGGGQTFLSYTKPGVTRGDHFHLNKVERFLVLRGEAVIRMRHVLHDEVHTYNVNGETPTPVDMPTLYTHSIENVGETDLLTLFWTHDMFDPNAPDTYADKVLT